MFLKNSSGFSLIEALVAIAVGLMVSYGLVTMQLNQQKETKSITEKMLILDFEKLLLQTLSDGSVCTFMLTNTSYDPANPKTFDETLIGSATPPVIQLPGNQIVGSTAATVAAGPFLAKNGQRPFADRNLVVNTIALKNIQTLGPTSYRAEFEIDFDQTLLVRSSKPIRLSTVLRTDNSSPRRVTSCGVVTSASSAYWLGTALNDGIFYNVGKVGIGTDSPVSKLHVSDIDQTVVARVRNESSSTARWPGFVSENFSGSITGSPVLVLKNSRGTLAAPSALSAGDYVGLWAVQGQYGPMASQFYQSGSIQFTANSNFSATSAGTNIIFRTLADGETAPIGGTERMRIAHNGNVGIGESDPQRLLHLKFFNPANDGTNGRLVIENSGGTAGSSSAIQFRSGNALAPQGLQFTPNPSNRMIFHTFGFSGNYGGYFFQFDNGASVPMIIRYPTGNVGLGTMTPGYRLDVNGDINIAPSSSLRFGGTSVCTSTGCASSSDRTLKENIAPIEDSLKKVLKLQGVEYNFKDKGSYTPNRQIGLIAQDVELIFPEVVTKDQKSGLRSVAYDHLVAPLIESIKTLYQRLREIEIRQTRQQYENESLVALKKSNEMILKQLEFTKKEVLDVKGQNAELSARLEKVEMQLNTNK